MRYLQSATYAAASNRMTVFGGQNFSGFFNDVWVLMKANGLGGPPSWVQLYPTGTPPTARAGHTSVYDAASSRMTVFGEDFFGLLNDVWVLTNANGVETPAWIQLTPTGGPSARNNHSATTIQPPTA